MADTFKFVQAQSFALSGAGAVSGATSITLKSFTQIDGTLLTMTDFGNIGFLTMEPGNGTLEEQVSFTGISQNANGTATLTGVSSIGMVSPYTSTSGLAQTHAGSTSVIISNTSGFYDRLTAKGDDETITGVWTFTNPNYPRMDTSTPFPVDNEQLATKAYADSLTFAGAPNATTTQKGIVELPTQVEMDAGTAIGGTGASLTPTPALIRSRLLSDYVADSGAANAYVITPAPAIAGYVTGQIFSFKATNANTTTSTLAVNGFAAITIKKLGNTNLASGDIAAGQIVMVEYDGTNFQMLQPVANAPATAATAVTTTSLRYGGTGADGALSITSGTTTINLAGASIVVKNYTSISITGTGALAFSNPAATGTLVVLKSQGDVTLTSSATPMIDMRSIGAAGGAQVTASNAAGNAGSNGSLISLVKTNAGSAPASGGAAGTGGAAPSAISVPTTYNLTLMKYPMALVGAGGSSGATNNGAPTNSGAGGAGGGGLVIECRGALNFTTASGISSAGANGANAVEPGAAVGGGGGGGAGGFVLITYNTLTAASGTVVVTGGTGGNSGASGSGQDRAGGAGGGSVNAGSNGTVTASANTKCGGDGGAGVSLIAANTEYV